MVRKQDMVYSLRFTPNENTFEGTLVSLKHKMSQHYYLYPRLKVNVFF